MFFEINFTPFSVASAPSAVKRSFVPARPGLTLILFV